MKIRRTIQGFFIVMLLACASWLLAFWYLVHLEDYSPKPGSIVYYIGISSLVRNAPVPDAAAEPEYFGSVGDGNKLPQSEISFATHAQHVGRAMDALSSYLRKASFQQRPVSADAVNNAASLIPEGVHLASYTEYVSSASEVVVLTVTKAADADNRYKVTMTHYD